MRIKNKLFRVEGPQAVAQLLEFKPWLVQNLYLSEIAFENHPQILNLAQANSIKAQVVSAQVIAAMVKDQGKESLVNPQGVVAVCQIENIQLSQVLKDLPDGPLTLVICERIQDPGNAGVVIRTADAAGCEAAFFSEESVDILSPKVVRASVGSIFHLPIASQISLRELIISLKSLGISIIGTSPRASTNLFDWQMPKRTAWILGNEAQGISLETLKLCDEVVSIPIYGRAESLNIATAASLCLFEAARNRVANE